MTFKVRIAVSLACAAAAVAFMAVYAAGVRGEAADQRRDALERYGGETASVYVATRDIAQGETFNERNVETMEWLVDLLPEGALGEGDDILGETSASSIARNTPLASVDVSERDAALDVPAGLVAVSVPCSSESAVGGALSPGSTVDVYVVSGDAARLLCRGVQVLATNANATAASLSWATVAVDPSQVEALIAASALQGLYFVLPSDEELERRAAEAAEGASQPADAAQGGGGSEAAAPVDGVPAEGQAAPVGGETAGETPSL